VESCEFKSSVTASNQIGDLNRLRDFLNERTTGKCGIEILNAEMLNSFQDWLLIQARAGRWTVYKAYRNYKSIAAIIVHLSDRHRALPRMEEVPGFNVRNVLSSITPRDGYSTATLERIDTAALEKVREARERIRTGRRLAGEGTTNTCIKGWTTNIKNPLAYITKVLDCRLIGKREVDAEHRILDSAHRRYGGMFSVVSQLHPTIEDAAAFMIRIGSLTGLNLQSIRDLEINCIESDALPGRSRIRYSKNRSGVDLATIAVSDRGDMDPAGLVRMYIELSRDLRRHAPQGNRLNRDEMPHWQDSCLRPGLPQWFQSGKLLTIRPFFA
jgi:hypothetical protein